MDFLQILVLTLHIAQVYTKSKSRSRSRMHQMIGSDEDSIENLLYYKDCQKRAKEQTTEVPEPMVYEPPPTPAPRTPECAFPKMCCAMTCGNDCSGNQQQNFISRQMEPAQSMNQLQPIMPPDLRQPRQPPGMGAVQPQIVQRRKKKLKFPPNKMQPPMMGTRRDFGSTKEKIKSLISQDDDIRKILKELVRVTMQKVDLVDKINSRKTSDVTPPVPFDDYED